MAVCPVWAWENLLIAFALLACDLGVAIRVVGSVPWSGAWNVSFRHMFLDFEANFFESLFGVTLVVGLPVRKVRNNEVVDGAIVVKSAEQHGESFVVLSRVPIVWGDIGCQNDIVTVEFSHTAVVFDFKSASIDE